VNVNSPLSPDLHSCIKATTVKLLVCFLAQYTGRRVRAGDVYAETRATCLWSASEFMHVCDRAGAVLSDAQKLRLENLGKLHSMSFFAMYDLAGKGSFHIRPKLHYWEEMVLQTVELGLNPKHLACWGEESLLGRIKRVSQRCHGKTMLATSMKRYSLALSRRWEKRRKSQRWFIGA
jgi:hypothetical protein